jgi:hypothetical protein
MIPSLLQIPSAVSDSKLHSVLPNNGKGDFQFERSTGATRINRDGLIEEVGYFSSELVQNGNFSELGSELITPEANRDFSSNTGYWTLETGVTIGNGKLNFTEAANNRSFYKLNLITNGKTYKLEITISGYVEGFIDSNNGNNFTFPSSNGTHTVYFVGGNPHLVLGANGTTTLSIDNISVKQVDPNDRWTLSSGWSYGANKVIGSATNTFDNVAQNNLSISGKQLKLTFDIVDYTSGTFRLFPTTRQDGLDERYSGNGSYQVIYTSTVDSLQLQQQNFVGGITNISLVEVQGDRPRLSYDITNGVVEDTPHLLLEPSSTNLLTFSEDFSGWTKQNITDTANATTSPDGANNGTQLTNTTTSSNYIYRQVTLSTSTAYSISVFVKKGTSNITRLDVWDTTGSTQASIQLNLDTEAISVTTGTASFVKYPNDWYRLKVSFTSSGSLGTTFYRIFNSDGVNGSYIYIFGATLEQQAYCTSYIKTAGTAITRAAETCNNSKPSVNSTEGVLYAEIQALASDSTAKEITISDGTTNNRVIISYNTANQIRINYRNSSSNIFDQSNSTTITDFHKIAVKWKANDFSFYLDGSEVASSTSGSVMSANTLTTVNFDDGAGTFDFYGKVKGLAVYNEALSESQLMQLTGVTASSIYNNFVTRTASFTVEALNEVKKVIDNL